jgi:RecA/RadA recombinase
MKLILEKLMMGMVLMILIMTTSAIGNITVVDSEISLEPGSNRTLFVVSTSNSLKRTIQLLKYLQNLKKSVDILVIDSSSTDGTREFLQGKVQMISFI